MDPADLPKQFHTYPYVRHLGLELEHVEPGYARLRMPVREVHLQAMGVMHGGILVVLADSAFFHALAATLSPGESTTTVELKVNYLSPARPGDVLVGEGRVVQRGSRVAVGDMEVREATSGRLVLKGLGTCLIMRLQPNAASERAER